MQKGPGTLIIVGISSSSPAKHPAMDRKSEIQKSKLFFLIYSFVPSIYVLELLF